MSLYHTIHPNNLTSELAAVENVAHEIMALNNTLHEIKSVMEKMIPAQEKKFSAPEDIANAILKAADARTVFDALDILPMTTLDNMQRMILSIINDRPTKG